MITGLLPPTAGNIFIDGRSVREEITYLRQTMGVCPQENILWDNLTVAGHIQLFGQLRGIPYLQILMESAQLLDALDMLDVQYTLAGNLSGGQKRRESHHGHRH